MKSNTKKQYTVRGVPSHLDKALRQRAKEEGKSLNEVLLNSLHVTAGELSQPFSYHDLDGLVGTWKEDPLFDEYLAAQNQIDEDLWR